MPKKPYPPYVSQSGKVALITQSSSIAPYTKGTATYGEAIRNLLVEAYYQSKGNLAEACRSTDVNYAAARRWRKLYQDFNEALILVEDLIREKAHELFMQRVMDPGERHPAWLIFYLKKWDPRYFEKPQQKKIVVTIEDNTFGSRVIDAKVIREALPAGKDVVDGEILDDRDSQSP